MLKFDEICMRAKTKSRKKSLCKKGEFAHDWTEPMSAQITLK